MQVSFRISEQDFRDGFNLLRRNTLSWRLVTAAFMVMTFVVLTHYEGRLIHNLAHPGNTATVGNPWEGVPGSLGLHSP
jgi:hypothetical protein